VFEVFAQGYINGQAGRDIAAAEADRCFCNDGRGATVDLEAVFFAHDLVSAQRGWLDDHFPCHDFSDFLPEFGVVFDFVRNQYRLLKHG
jgi:hypothetical protein